MAGQEEDLSDQADERMGIEVRRDGMKKYLQDAGIYKQLVQAMTRMYFGRKTGAVQGIDGLKSGLGATDQEVEELEDAIEKEQKVADGKKDLIVSLKEQIKAIRSYDFEELLAFREILRGESGLEEPVPKPPMIPMQKDMENFLQRNKLPIFSLKPLFEKNSFIKFNQLLPFIPEFLQSDEVKEQVQREQLEWKEVLVPCKDDKNQDIWEIQYDPETKVEEFDEEGNVTNVTMDPIYVTDEEGNQILGEPTEEFPEGAPKPLTKQKFKKYYYNRANNYTTWVRPEILGEDLDAAEEEKVEDVTDKSGKKKIKYKYKIFDFVDYRKDKDWYTTSKTVTKGKGKKKREITTVTGGYEPGYVIAMNEDGSYDIQFGRREESTFTKEMQTSWDDDGNEIEVEAEVEHLGDIITLQGITEKDLQAWKPTHLNPDGTPHKGSFKKMKPRARCRFMNHHFIKTGTVGSTPREIKSEQSENIDKFLKNLSAMRRDCKDMFYAEEKKITDALEAKKPIIRKAHYKELNKKLKELKISKQFRKKIATALRLLDKPEKQMQDRLPKILQELYGAGICIPTKEGSYEDLAEEWAYCKLNEEVDEDAKPPKKWKLWRKIEDKDELKKIKEGTDMGRIIENIVDGDMEKFTTELMYKMQGLRAGKKNDIEWDMWIDDLEMFKTKVPEGFGEWMGELAAAEAEKEKERAEAAEKERRARYPDEHPFDGLDNEEIFKVESFNADEDILDQWKQFWDMTAEDGVVSNEDGTKETTIMWLSNIFNGKGHCPNQEEAGEWDSEEYNKVYDVWLGDLEKDEEEKDPKKMSEDNLFTMVNEMYQAEGPYGGNNTTKLQHIWLIKEAMGMPHP